MFTKIMYINLERRMDRKKNIEEQLKLINYKGPVERINAIDARHLNIPNLSDKLITRKGINSALNKNNGLYTFLTKGAIGCALSHRIAWEKVIKGNDEYVLILEDDIWFDKYFNKKLENIMKIVPSYDILYLGNSGYYNNLEGRYLDIPNLVYGLFAYIINKKAATLLLNVFPITYQLDTEISKKFNYLKVYTLKYDKNSSSIDYRIIFSELSQNSITYGTDIQHREYFSNTNEKLETTDNCNSVILLFVFGIVIVYLYLRNKKK